MKGYHTIIEIDAPPSKVWQELTNFGDYGDWNPLIGELEGDLYEGGEIKIYVVPLRQKFKTAFAAYREEREMRWLATPLHSSIIYANHYYLLEPLDEGKRTLLKHGEKFTGILSYLMPPFVLNRMRRAFELHNERLKSRVEK